jgi:hypothetical protein
MIVAWSEASKQSDWVRGEAGIGRERNILVPILFEPVEPPITFRSLHTENLSTWEGDSGAQDFIKLCQAISGLIKQIKRPILLTNRPTNPPPQYPITQKTVHSNKA